MAKPGPKTKPALIKALEGNPGKRKLPEGYVKPDGEPEKPDYVTDYAAVVWDRVMRSMPPGVYTASDVEILAAYCLACRDIRSAQQHMDIEGRVLHLPTKDGYVVKRNPWGQIAREAASVMAALGSRLGLDPTSRESIKAPPEKTPDTFGELIGIDGGRK